MTDTEILDRILGVMKVYSQQLSPISPKNAASLVECAEYDRGCKRDTYTNGTSFSDQTVSEFFRTPGPYATTAVIENYGLPGQRTVRTTVPVSPPPWFVDAYQRFWRCRHHPDAIHNWSEDSHCEHGCAKSELRWFDHGINQ